MSKVLKFIVHFIVVFLILIVLALALPPFFGVTTQIQDDSDSRTNLPLGSVAYAIPVKSSEAKVGDALLVTEDSTVYRYSLAALDLANGRGTVVDPTVANSQPVKVAIRDYVPRIVLQVPLIGYLLMATQSTEGLIIIGLVVLFLVILYIIAELWKKSPEKEEPVYDTPIFEEPEEEPVASGLQQPVYEDLPVRRPRGKVRDGKIRTGGFVDEVDESDFEDEDEYYEDEYPEDEMLSATSEAHEVLKQGIAATTAEQDPDLDLRELTHSRMERTNRPRKSARPYGTSPARRQAQPVQAEEPEEPKPPKKLAIPRYSAAQLAQKAKKAGDTPEVIKDDVTDVTLFDYSDIFAEAESSLDEEGDF